jgi:hypothetical protein
MFSNRYRRLPPECAVAAAPVVPDLEVRIDRSPPRRVHCRLPVSNVNLRVVSAEPGEQLVGSDVLDAHPEGSSTPASTLVTPRSRTGDASPRRAGSRRSGVASFVASNDGAPWD